MERTDINNLLNALTDKTGVNDSTELMNRVDALGASITENKSIMTEYKSMVQQYIDSITTLINRISELIALLSNKIDELSRNPKPDDNAIKDLQNAKAALINVIQYANRILSTNPLDNTMLQVDDTETKFKSIIEQLTKAGDDAETALQNSGVNPSEISSPSTVVPSAAGGGGGGVTGSLPIPPPDTPKNILAILNNTTAYTQGGNVDEVLQKFSINRDIYKYVQTDSASRWPPLETYIRKMYTYYQTPTDKRGGGKRTRRHHSTKKSRTLRKTKKSKTLRKSTKSRTLRKMKKRNYRGGFHAEAVKSRRNSKRRHDTSTH